VARRDRGTSEVRLDEDADGGGLALDTAGAIPPTGPHDGDDLDPEVTDAAGLVDFGAIRVPLPPNGKVTVEPTANGRMQAVHIALPEGRLSVSALAAPKSSTLWSELAREIDASLREGGARVRSFPGNWGRELHATSGGATSVFVGVDGPRWMLYGVATGPTAQAATLDAELRRMLRGTVVVRGKQPYPVRTILPLAMPDHLAAEVAAASGSTPAVAAAGTKKRSPGKSGAGKSAPGKAAPGKTSPPKSDATSAAAKKAAARRAAARKAAAAAAVKAAAEALAEHAAEDRAAAVERATDTGSAARVARTGAYPAPGTIATGPGPDAPLREQAPSARRAAAAPWRSRPAAPEFEESRPTEPLPVARPVDVPPVTEALPAGRDLPPTGALRRVEPGSGGRRRLREPAPAPDLPPGGRRHLPESVADEPRPAARRRLPEPVSEAYVPEPPEPGVGGRRRLREPAAELPPPDRRQLREPDGPGALDGPGGGRGRLPEPDGGAVGVTAPWDLGGPKGGRRHLVEPGPRPDTTDGRRRLREPFGEPGRAGADPREPGARPGVAAADTGVSASGRRRLRESWDETVGGAGGQSWEPGVGSGSPAADVGVSASGRRRLRESMDEVGPGGGPQPWETVSRGPNGSGAPGSRGRRPPAEPFGEPRRAGAESGDPVGGPSASAADTGVSASGRRRLRESWDEAGRGTGRPPWEPGPGGLNGSGASGSGGRRRLDDPFDEFGRSTGAEPRATDAGLSDRPGPRAGDAGGGTPPGGRRHLREPFGEPGRIGGPGSWEMAAGGRPDRSEELGAGGRRHLSESSGEPGPRGGREPGRRRLREPSGEPEPYVRPEAEPAAHDPGVRRREAEMGEGPVSGTGGQRPRREPDPPPPVRNGSPIEPWLFGPDGPRNDRSARRTLDAEYLVDTGEQDAGWAEALDGYAEQRRGGRRSGGGVGEGSPPTVRLRALLADRDPNRPSGRHRRSS
jgi:Protein of unknown function (DUF3710)